MNKQISIYGHMCDIISEWQEQNATYKQCTPPSFVLVKDKDSGKYYAEVHTQVFARKNVFSGKEKSPKDKVIILPDSLGYTEQPTDMEVYRDYLVFEYAYYSNEAHIDVLEGEREDEYDNPELYKKIEELSQKLDKGHRSKVNKKIKMKGSQNG